MRDTLKGWKNLVWSNAKKDFKVDLFLERRKGALVQKSSKLEMTP